MQLSAHIGKLRGSVKSKDNRTARLLHQWDDMRTLMGKFVVAGRGMTLRARCAYGVLLMMDTGIRIGNETSAEGYVCGQKHHADYGKQVKVYGLTTLLREHVHVSNGTLFLNFLGKKAVKQELRTSNSILVRYSSMIGNSSNTWLGIDYRDIYKFVKRSIGRKFKPKDIRTAAVNKLFIDKLRKASILQKKYTTKRDAGAALRMAVEATAKEIGHTAGVCKSAYISKSLMSTLKARMDDIVARERERQKQKKRR